MNLTILALASTWLSNSPMLLLNERMSRSSIGLNKLILSNFFTNAIYSWNTNQNFSISESSFSNFMKSPLKFTSSEEIIKNQEFSSTLNTFTQDNIYIATCTFTNCQTNTRGGAICCTGRECELTLHESIFEKCTAVGDGGAIFVCKNIGNSGSSMTHTKVQLFDSLYCCYSHCYAQRNDNGNGYGSAMLVAASTLKLFFSSSSECPDGSLQSTGAQFDLASTDIESRYINATTGNSVYCAGIEYRDATSGYFQFQTVINQKGGFTTSFTSVAMDVEISFCNFINETVYNLGDSTPAVIHIRMQSIVIKNFVFAGITISSGRLVSLSGDTGSSGKTLTIENCLIDQNLDIGYLNGITYENKNNSFNAIIQTLDIPQLNLGNCAGVITAPPIVITEPFTASSAFSASKGFSASSAFSLSKAFTASKYFSTPKSDLDSDLETTEYDSISITNDGGGNIGGGDNAEGVSTTKSSMSTGAIAGIAVGAAVLPAIIILVTTLLLCRKKNNMVSEGANAMHEGGAELQTENPLYNKSPEDPFKEDFNDEPEQNGSFVL
ncbi:hypothetical protein TRFO_28799 [Tritrichomonas foetus]|uniref:Uncharacterized protein n=1 Tax=Tritrichomonas foetus TaxID=1144522 RepID=A0A1J4JY22_9EUKA|nr:hypothetical protein TRFO_28799 [Tritrichomonas foetus]|eukprot:OHT03891.1 hypothetical protein TRFO_28799 [Tritrichomonas foetus]